MMKLGAAVLAGLVLAGGCASAPKPCTAEWMDWKRDNLIRDFASSHRADLGTVREFSNLVSGRNGKPTVLEMATLAPRLVVLAGDFVDMAEPEVRSVYAQCGTGPKTAQLFADLLRREGVSESLVETIEEMGLLLDGRA